MRADRYLKIVLTVIAIELFWIGVRDFAPPASAQPAATRVIVQGIELEGIESGRLPVVLVDAQATVPVAAAGAISVTADRPLPVQADRPVPIEAARPIPVETHRPLQVEQVPYMPSPRPGE